jgi:Bifunctional DNA primase/polymerase, N-terminal
LNRHDQAAAARLKLWPLLQRRLYPIPVNPRTRAPLVEWGELDRLGYRPGVGERIEGTYGPWTALVFEWWDRWPLAGAAVLTGLSRLLVVDVDPRNNGHHALAALVTGRPLPATRTVRSRSGGLHLYYRTDRLVRSGTGALGAGLDVKSHRGLVVCPPTPGYSLLERRPVAQAPPWLLGRLQPVGGRRRRSGVRPALTLADAKARAALDRALAAIAAAPAGQGHAVTHREACRAFAVVDDDQAEVELIAAAWARCRPSDRREREQAVRDARTWVRGRRR